MEGKGRAGGGTAWGGGGGGMAMSSSSPSLDLYVVLLYLFQTNRINLIQSNPILEATLNRSHLIVSQSLALVETRR